MQIGEISGETFDISDFDETNSILVRNEINGVVSTKWIYQDENGVMVQLIREVNAGTTLQTGTKIAISSVPGVGVPTLQNDAVAITLTDVDFNSSSFASRSVVDSLGNTITALLVPVRLL